jgi:CBS domain-containing protein
MRVQEIMTPSPRSARPSDSVMAVAAMMRDEDVGAIPITDEEGRLQGIITDRDITIQVVAAGQNPADVQVADAMTRNPTTIGPGAEVAQAADLMAAEQIRRLPVVQGGRLVAMLSLGDVATAQGQEMDTAAAEALEEISEPVH